MRKLKIFGLSFGFVFVLTAILCMISGLPFIYAPVDYGLTGFFKLALLLGFLVFCLVYVNFPVLKWIKDKAFKSANDFIFHLTATLLILQVVTLITGYMESLTTRGVEPDFFYYYKCVTNSCIYILTGNLTVLLGCRLFTRKIS
jgi:hypothetical protein